MTKKIPYTFVCGQQEAAEAFCRIRGIHPSMFKPVVCWPNLAGYPPGYKLWLVRGHQDVEDIERIVHRAKQYGFEVGYA